MVAYSYKSPNRDQQFLLPPSVADWLPEDHLVWFVIDVVSMVDLSRFHARHPNDGAGRRAYDPVMMLTLLLYAYCVGLRSSRRIAAACRSDLAFKAICVDVVPAHDAVGRFRADHETAIIDVFVDVLTLCAQAGLASLGTIAIDGTKIGSDAALDQNRSLASIRAEVERILAEAAEADEHDPPQPPLSGELPAELARRGTRLARLQAAAAEIEAQAAARRAVGEAAAQRAASEAVAGRKLRGRKPADPHLAVRRAEADVAASKAKLLSTRGNKAREQAAEGLAAAEQRLVSATAAATAAGPGEDLKANTTDPQSRIMKTASGWVQGYNAQAAVNAGQVVIAARVTQDHNDVAQLMPMIEAVVANGRAAGVADAIGTVVADAGYWSDDNATAPGPDRLIATTKDWKQRRAARQLGATTGPPPPQASPLEAMEHRLRTADGARAYAVRSHTVEPVFGQAKENRGYRRFMRRGLHAANSEWALICATSNLLKLFGHANGRPLGHILNASI